MKDLIELTAKAKEIYELGIRMQETFSTTEDTKANYMLMAIAAGLKEAYASNVSPAIVEENFGEQIKRIRTEKKITLRQIEDATGVSNSYLSQLENGKIKKPSHSVVTKIMGFLTTGTSAKSDMYLPGNGVKFDFEELGYNPLVPGSGLKGL